MIDYFLPVLSYFCGSLSSAILVCRIMHLDDPRQSGSGNPGATNVMRLYGKRAAIPTLAGDVLKGILPLLLAHALNASEIIIALCAFAAFIGHLYPVFFGFKGGKGIATFLGVLFGIYWPLGIAYMICWTSIALLFRYSSLAGLVASALSPVFVIVLVPKAGYLISVLIMVMFMFWRHRSNIRNLLDGKEEKIGDKKPVR